MSIVKLSKCDKSFLEEILNRKYETTRTPFCTIPDADGVRLPKYLVAYSDGTTAVLDPVDGEDNWCECNC